MVKFVNCTPHPVTVLVPKGSISYPTTGAFSSGVVARVDTLRKEIPNDLGFRLVRQTFGNVVGLPEPEDGTVYIVSGMVLQALNGSRIDVVAPDTGADAVRENGQIVAVRGFVC